MVHGTGPYGPDQGVRHTPTRRRAVAVLLRTAAGAALAAVIAGSAVARRRRWLLPSTPRVAALAFLSTPLRPAELLNPLRRPRAAAGHAARLPRCRRCAGSTPAGNAELNDLDDFELDFVADGVLQDDWNDYVEKAEEEAADKVLAEAASSDFEPDFVPDFEGQEPWMKEANITHAEEWALTQELVEAWDQGKRHPEQNYEILEKLRKYEPTDKEDRAELDERLGKLFDKVGGGSGDKWKMVQLNDTLIMNMAEVPGVMDKIEATLNSTKAPEIAFEAFVHGYGISAAATILSRWLAIHPPLVHLDGKSVIELGAGCGMPGIVAARLGAAKVLLQDRDVVPLREALESSIEAGLAEKVSTITIPWVDFPARLLTGSEEALQPFQKADIILASDVLLSEAVSEVLADVLSQLLQTPDQVAYVAEFYRGIMRKYFGKCCRGHGLSVVDREIATWEPRGDNPLEAEKEWFINLLTIQRM